jgi:flagellar biosynthetic protein FlhB
VIPEELFVAVATVLAFVFQLERAAAEGTAPPVVDVPSSHRFDPEGRHQA